jgi:hypothetical protein
MKIAASSFILHPSSFPRYLPHHSPEQKKPPARQWTLATTEQS